MSQYDGGALYVDEGSEVFNTNTLFIGCEAGRNGGAVFSEGTATFRGTSDLIANNAKTGTGGALYLAWSVTTEFELRDARFERNQAALLGGAMFIDPSMGSPNASCVDCNIAHYSDLPCWYARNDTWREWTNNARLSLSDIAFTHNSANVSGDPIHARVVTLF